MLAGHRVTDLLLDGAIHVAVDLHVLDEGTLVDQLSEFVPRHEEVVLSVDLSLSWLAGRVTHGKAIKIGVGFREVADQGSLASSGWTHDDQRPVEVFAILNDLLSELFHCQLLNFGRWNFSKYAHALSGLIQCCRHLLLQFRDTTKAVCQVDEGRIEMLALLVYFLAYVDELLKQDLLLLDVLRHLGQPNHCRLKHLNVCLPVGSQKVLDCL